MAYNVLFLDDMASVQKNSTKNVVSQNPFLTELKTRDFFILTTSSKSEAENWIQKYPLDLILYGGTSLPLFDFCQSVLKSSSTIPVMFILSKDDPRKKNLRKGDLCQILPPLTTPKRFIHRAQQLCRIGRLYRRVSKLTALETGPNTVDQMFSKLDAHHILDRVLHYFGSRLEVENIHWMRWSELPHLLQGDHSSVHMEMELVTLRSPKLMSYRESSIANFLTQLRTNLAITDLPTLSQNRYLLRSHQNEQNLFISVISLDGQTPLGLLWLEKCAWGEGDNLAPQMLETLRLMSRFIEFGLTFWDSKHMSMMDELTELYNQRFLPVLLENEINRSKRMGQSFCCLFMDLDYFKKVNDTNGHWIGSKLLTEVGHLLKKTIRSCDFGFRYGGDEFVVVLPYTDITGGQIVAERIRKTIEEFAFMIDGREVRLTISIGLASYPQHAKTKEQIIQLADHAMYFAKRQSRNIVYVASS